MLIDVYFRSVNFSKQITMKFHPKNYASLWEFSSNKKSVVKDNYLPKYDYFSFTANVLIINIIIERIV